MGLGLYFEEGEGPKFKTTISNARDVANIGIPDPELELRYVMDAVRLIRKELDGKVPLIGFAGSPWTLATYMVEGGSTKTFSRSKGMLYNEPQLLHRMLDTIADAVIAYLNAQIAAGAQTVMHARAAEWLAAHPGRDSAPPPMVWSVITEMKGMP